MSFCANPKPDKAVEFDMKTYQKIIIGLSFLGNFLVLAAFLIFILFFRDAVRNRYAIPIHQNRTSQFDLLPVDTNDIIMLGNSITEHGEWTEWFDSPDVKNRGIGSDITSGVLSRLEQITRGKPAKIFIKIGTNDITLGYSEEEILSNYRKILETIKRESPNTSVYVQSIIPIGGRQSNLEKRMKKIRELNPKLKVLAEKQQVTFLDIFTPFLDADQQQLDDRFSADGIHLNGPGYALWVDLIREAVEE